MEEMQALTRKAKKVDFYYHKMAKFKSLQMEHVFTKVELLMHQNQGCKNNVKPLESLKGKVANVATLALGS
jgi:hypothetical protein